MDTIKSSECNSLSTSAKSENLAGISGLVYKSNECIGVGNFTFPNKDIYSGSFKASRNGRIVRDGNGIYTTSDGHIYDSAWASDVLECPDALIQFPDGSSYHGSMVDQKYNGYGCYSFPDGTFIDAKFLNNYPVEGKDSSSHINFTDSNGTEWFGKIDEGSIILLPSHQFIPKEWNYDFKHFPLLLDTFSHGIPTKRAKPKFMYPILDKDTGENVMNHTQ